MQEITSTIIRFYSGTGADDRDRMLAEILRWDDGRLERVHDYIQWLFPLPERSAFNAGAPVLTDADIGAFRNRADLRAALRRTLSRLLAFYGFEIREAAGGEPAVIRAPGYPERSRNWLTPGNHNFLRISRILRALTLLGLETEARASLVALEAVHAENGDVIGTVTLAYWRRAIEG